MRKKIISVILVISLLMGGIPYLKFGDSTSYAADKKGLVVKYDDFGNTTGIQLTSNACTTGGVLTVSPNNGTSFATGVVYTSEKIKLKNESSFSTYFSFDFSDKSIYPADGMTFSLQPVSNSALGPSSNRFAIYNIEPDLSIEFDSFRNSDMADSSIEPSGNHIAVFKNGDPYGQNIKTVIAPAGLNSWNSNIYHVWIDYDGMTDTLTVKMNTTQNLASATTVLTVFDLDVYEILGSDETYAGFTAASGMYQQNHNVHNWYMCNDYSPINPTEEYYETTSLTSKITTVSTTESEITYTLTDHLGQSITGEVINFEATEGILSIENGTTDANGQINVSLQSSTLIDAVVTATTDSGRLNRASISIEGVKVLSDQESVDADYAVLNTNVLLNGNIDAQNIITDLLLPESGENGTTITWISSNTQIISNTGVVTRPSRTIGDQTVTLTATVSKETAIAKTTVPFEFIVKARDLLAEEIVLADFKWLRGQVILNGNPSSDVIKTDLSFPTVGPNGSTIIWKTFNSNLISVDGTVTRPSYTEGNQLVKVTSTNTMDGINRTKYYVFNVIKEAPSDTKSVEEDLGGLSYPTLIGENASPFSIECNLQLPLSGVYGSTITWTSSNPEIITNDGIVNRPTYEEGFCSLVLTATAQKGAASSSKDFQMVVNPLPDTVAPTIQSFTPANRDTIFNNCTAVINFSEDIMVADTSKILVTVTNENNSVISAAFNKLVDGNNLTIEPVYEITDTDQIHIQIQKGAVEDLSQNKLMSNFDLSFTRKRSRPVLTSSNIQNNQKSVNVNQVYEFIFDKEISLDESLITFESVSGWKRDEVEFDISKDSNTVTITPLYDLLPDYNYELNILNEAVKDDSQNPMKNDIKAKFSTAPITEINLTYPLKADDAYIYGDYIKLDFDQYFDVSISSPRGIYNYNYSSYWVDYFIFGKSLFISTNGLSHKNINGKECYYIGNIKVYSTHNSNCKASLASSEAIQIRPYRFREYGFPVANTGSSPKIPVDFGEEINTPYVALDYGQEIQALDLSLVQLENEYSRLVDITSEVDGTKLIIKPSSGEWIPSQSYILKVPEGSISFLGGTVVKRFEYPFKTPVKYDYSGSSVYVGNSKVFVGSDKTVHINIRCDKYKGWFDYELHTQITNLSTGEVIIDKDGLNYYTFKQDIPGIYEVLYTISKNGYRYEFKNTYEVLAINDSETEMVADRTGVVKVIDYTSFDDEYLTKVRLSNGDIPVGGRTIKLELIGKKTGNIYYTHKTKTNNSTGEARFYLPVDDLPEGTLKVVLTDTNTNKSCMYYLQTKKVAGKSKVNILLYDVKTKKLIRSNETINVTIDNSSTIQAKRLSNYTYEMEVRPGIHTLRFSNIPYYNSKNITVNLKSGKNKTPAYLGRYIPSTNITMSSTEIDYGKSNGNSNGKDRIFIDGVDAEVNLETTAYWSGHEAGKIIYEFYKNNNVKKVMSNDGKITVNMGDLFGAGTRGRVYAVSKDGTVSAKRDINIEVAGKPSYCYVSYSDKKKQYFMNYNFSLETMGSVSVPKDWPLIGGDNMEIDIGKFQVGGVMDPYGKIEFVVGLSKVEFENAKVVSNYKKLAKNFKAGNWKFAKKDSDLSFSFDTNQSWQYDCNKNAWKYINGNYILYLEGEASYKQYFMLFVVPTYLEGKIGVDASAKLNVEMVVSNPVQKSEKLKYSGELKAAPYLEFIIGSGVKGLNVEGFANGTIDTSISIPEFDVGVNAKITGGVRATALFWKWEKSLEYTFVLAKQNRRLLSLGADINEAEQSDFNMIQRGSTDSSVWVGYQQVPVQSDISPFISDSTLFQKAPDFTSTALTSLNNNLFMVWPEDNPSRTSTNRTELKYATFDGLQWTEGEFFNQDGTADYNPVIIRAGDIVNIAWQDQNRLMTEQDELEDYLASTEISVAKYDEENAVFNFVTLTDDNYYDCIPAMAYSDGKTHLVWAKNKSNNILSPEAGSFDILYSQDSGMGWSTPVVLESGLNQITDLDIAANGDNVTIIYSVDEDGDIFTTTDVELYAKEAFDDSWSPSVILTDDQNHDGNARLMVKNGDIVAIWLKDGVLTEMNIGTKDVSSVKNISAQEFEIIKSDNGMEAVAYTTQIQDGLQSIATIFYDSSTRQWSEPVIISQDNYINSNIGAVITRNNEMTVIHKATEKIIEEIEGDVSVNVGHANIKMHKMTLVKDLKVAEDSIGFDAPFLLNDSNELQVVVENCGQFTVNNFDVAFYDGLMNQIGVESVNTPLIPGARTTVSTTWLSPETLQNGNITIVIDPNNHISDADQTNNKLTKTVITADVSIEDVETYSISDNNYLLKLVLGNYTSIDAENVQIAFYHNDSLINTQVIDSIGCGLEEEVLMELDTSALFEETNVIDGRVEVRVLGSFIDGNTENNSAKLSFEKQSIQVVSSNITDGETEIPTNICIDLDFSGNINSAEGYDDIVITDFSGNIIPASKEITESRLMVKPQQKLETGTSYCLTVPQNALESENAQTLGTDYILGFTTDTSDLSVMGTYPLDSWTGVDREENIVLKFNDNILAGNDFESIQLLQNDTTAVSATVTIDGNMLIIDPKDSLLYNTTYTVCIPAWAVKDEIDNVLEQEYVFSFTTVNGTNPDIPKDDSHENHHNSNQEVLDTNGEYQELENEFIVDVSKYTGSFKASEKLINDIQNQNKPLKIVREDITITMQPEFATDVNQLQFTIASRSVSDENKNPRDRIISDIYTLSVDTGVSVYDYNGQFSATIPIDVTKIIDPEKCAAFYIDEEGNRYPAGGVMDTVSGTMQVNLYCNRPFIVMERDITFDDVENRWSQNAVEILAAKGIITGKSERHFDPSANITRAEFTAIVVRSLFKGTSDYQSHFNDFQSNEWYADSIEKAVELNLVNGVGDGRFAPNEKITREDMMVILYRLYKLRVLNEGTSGDASSTEEIINNTFSDFNSISHYASEAIIKMVDLGIVEGYDGKIAPKDPATREESAMMIYRLLQKMN